MSAPAYTWTGAMPSTNAFVSFDPYVCVGFRVNCAVTLCGHASHDTGFLISSDDSDEVSAMSAGEARSGSTATGEHPTRCVSMPL